MSALWKNPRHDLHRKSKEVFEASLATSLSLAVFLFLAFPSVPRPEPPLVGASDVIQIADIPNTDQQARFVQLSRALFPRSPTRRYFVTRTCRGFSHRFFSIQGSPGHSGARGDGLGARRRCLCDTAARREAMNKDA